MTTQSPIHVYDVWAKSAAGRTLHFDVILPVRDDELALQSAKTWLTSIGEENASVTAQTCAFCHTEAEASPEMAADIARDGYAIYKMEGCPK